MVSSTKERGEHAEQLACQYLTKQSLTLVQRNYACQSGEIDLIMRDHDDTLVFIEVRYRKHAHYGDALASVTRAKQNKIIKTAQHFLQCHHGKKIPPCRFDVLAVELNHTTPTFNWIQHAFSTD